jgi:PQQ-dependent catabolism-associated CXXCW motif protein
MRILSCLTAFLIANLLCTLTLAAPYEVMQARAPELFDPETGLRIARQRGPTPDNLPPPAEVVSPEQARDLIEKGALALDVFAASQSRFDDLDGTWLISEQRFSLPGAVWLPEVGRGQLEPELQNYLATNLARLTKYNQDHPVVVFCVADCWMSWNAAQRIAGLGYRKVYWFRLGTDGWLDIGGAVYPVDPIPVTLD